MVIKAGEDLADYVQRVRNVELKVSLKAVEEASGGEIDSSYVSQIENRAVLGANLTLKKISALAKGLQVPEEEILAVIRGKALNPDEVAEAEKSRFWAMYSDIPGQCRKDVMDLLLVLQRNHSISARHRRRGTEHKEGAVAAETTNPNGLRAVDDPQLTERGRRSLAKSLSEGHEGQIDNEPRKIYSDSLTGAEVETASQAENRSEDNEKGGRTRRQKRR